MRLKPLDLPPDPAPLPNAVQSFLQAGRERVDAYHRRAGRVPGTGSIPSDHELVYRVLRQCRRAMPDLRRFLEWGSGFGVVTGLAAQLGFEAHGIEVDLELVQASQALLLEHRLPATIAHGSFLPDDYEPDPELTDLEGRTVFTAADAYAAMDYDLGDFEVVFAFPWPGEEALYTDLFATRADYGAVLLTYAASDGVRGCCKVADRRAGGRPDAARG